MEGFCHIEDESIFEECSHWFMGVCGLSEQEQCPYEIEEEYKKFYVPAQDELEE